MKIQQLERIHQGDSVQSRFQDNINNFTNQFMMNPFLKGNFIEGIALTTSASQIEHKLGISPLGYIVTSQSANATVYSTAKDQNFLTLQASGNVTVSIWVF